MAKTAIKIDENDNEWIKNSAGYNFHKAYGFGAIDAVSAVRLAKGHNSFNDKLWKIKFYIEVDGAEIEENEFSAVKNFQVPPSTNNNNIFIESVELEIPKIEFKSNYGDIPDSKKLTLRLESPDDTILIHRTTYGDLRDEAPIKLVVNQFYGEKISGDNDRDWTIWITDENRINYTYKINILLNFYVTTNDITKSLKPIHD